LPLNPESENDMLPSRVPQPRPALARTAGDFGWYMAIREAEDQVNNCRARIRRLQKSIRVARKQIAKGVPFELSTNK
jgi:hypothetical protein